MYTNDKPIYQIDSVQLEWVLSELLDKKFDELLEKMNKPEVVHTRKETAELLGVRPNTVSSYITSGILKNKGVGRKILISSKEIDRILNKEKVSFKLVA